MKSDLHISQEKKLKNISDIAKKIGLKKSDLFLYGEYIAKIKSIPKRTKNAKLILVTAMSPTPAGEGKTTTTVGLSDALQKIAITSEATEISNFDSLLYRMPSCEIFLRDRSFMSRHLRT